MSLRHLMIVLFMLLPGMAMAQSGLTSGLPDEGRAEDFLFLRIAGGLMRLAKQTGEVSVCTQADDGWLCRPVADDPDPLETQIHSLSAAQARLIQKVSETERRLQELSGSVEALQARLEEPGQSTAPQRLSPPAAASSETRRRLEFFVRKLRRRFSARS